MNSTEQDNAAAPTGEMELITLGAGCFWCVEAAYNQLDGILSAVSGYMGGESEDPTYEAICTGATGHAEVVRVTFDPGKITLREILEWFWRLHDPTQLNRQGNDVGTQYRSVIFFESQAQRPIAEESLREASLDFPKPIVTVIEEAKKFHPAEDYHQDYYFQNKERNGYCQFLVAPKLEKLGLRS